MTSIDPGLRVAAAVREQLAALRERKATAASQGTTASPAARPRPHTVSPALVQRIAAIAADDPQRPRKAVRLYLEAQLAREFGAAIANDPAFAVLLDAVQDRMNEDAQLAASVDALAALLLTGKVAVA